VSNELFGADDPFRHPTWQRADLMVGAPSRPAEGYLICGLAWLARVLPLLRNVNQLVVLLVLYRKCLGARSRTVSLSNQELRLFGIGRYAKYRALTALQEAGVVSTGARNGRSTGVTLLNFP
jgi:hypothetical protein